jgi:hypothetical protein
VNRAERAREASRGRARPAEGRAAAAAGAAAAAAARGRDARAREARAEAPQGARGLVDKASHAHARWGRAKSGWREALRRRSVVSRLGGASWRPRGPADVGVSGGGLGAGRGHQEGVKSSAGNVECFPSGFRGS